MASSGGRARVADPLYLGLLWSSKLNSIRFVSMLMRGEAAFMFGGG